MIEQPQAGVHCVGRGCSSAEGLTGSANVRLEPSAAEPDTVQGEVKRSRSVAKKVGLT